MSPDQLVRPEILRLSAYHVPDARPIELEHTLQVR